MEDTYFVFEFRGKYEIRVRQFNHGDLEDYVNELSESIGAEALEAKFVGPHRWPKYMHLFDEGNILIIKGKTLTPIPETQITKFKIPWY